MKVSVIVFYYIVPFKPSLFIYTFYPLKSLVYTVFAQQKPPPVHTLGATNDTIWDPCLQKNNSPPPTPPPQKKKKNDYYWYINRKNIKEIHQNIPNPQPWIPTFLKKKENAKRPPQSSPALCRSPSPCLGQCCWEAFKHTCTFVQNKCRALL